MLEQQLQDLKMQVPGSSSEAPTNQGRRATFGTSTESSPGYQGSSYQSSVSPTPPLTGPPYGQSSFPPVAPHYPVTDSQSMAQETPSIVPPGAPAYSGVYSVNGVEFPVFPTTDTQGPLNGFSGSANIQPMPKPDIWGLNNVPPPSVGFNWFQAVSLEWISSQAEVSDQRQDMNREISFWTSRIRIVRHMPIST